MTYTLFFGYAPDKKFQNATDVLFFNNCLKKQFLHCNAGGEPSDRLKEVYKPVLTDTQCSTNVGGSYDVNTMLCAGYLAGGEGACAVCTTIIFTNRQLQ